jgi:hypothetical protein
LRVGVREHRFAHFVPILRRSAVPPFEFGRHTRPENNGIVNAAHAKSDVTNRHAEALVGAFVMIGGREHRM